LDPLTHFLTGACLGRSGFNRKSGLATAVMTIAADIPDLDVLANIGGPVFGFAHHRGFTHTFIGVPLDAAAAVLLVYGWHRWRLKRGHKPKFEPRWGRLFLFACVAALSHLLLDFTNNYGLRPFMPFDYHWYAWDIVFIVEPVLLVVLAGGLLLPRLFGLINEEIGARKRPFQGRGGAITALVLMCALWAVRDYQHRHALAAMRAVTYEDQEPLRAAANPYPGNPFVWHGVVETETFFETAPVDSLTPQVDPRGTARVFYKPEETPVTLAAKKSYLGRIYLDWARFPITETEPLPGGGYRVSFYDLRFRYPGIGRNTLGAAVVLDKNLRVVEEEMGGLLRRRKSERPPVD